MTDNNSQLRAVLLAALMVLWVFAGTMAFAGSAAALNGTNANFEGTVDVSPDGPSQTATYTETITFDSGVDNTEINSGEIDFQDANIDGVGQDDITITFIDDSEGTETVLDTTNANVNNNVLEFDHATVEPGTVDAADELEIQVEGVQNPGSQGTYTISGSLYSSNDQSDDEETLGTSSYTIGAPTGGVNSVDYADATWETGSIRYIGQQLAFFPDSEHDGNYRIHEVDYEAAQQLRAGQDLTIRNDGSIRVRTSTREGDYVITEGDSGNRRQVLTNSDGVQTGTNASSTRSVADGQAVVTIQAQDLNITAVDENEDELDEIRLDEEFNILTLSNRNDFSVDVTSDNLSQDDLEDLLASSDQLTLGDIDQGDDDEVFIDGFDGDFTLTNLSFGEGGADLSTGNYTLDFDVNDTDASDSFTLEVNDESDAEADFDEGVFPGVRGDIAQVSLTTDEDVDEVNITVGNADEQGYETYFIAEPNDDNEIRFNINTYTAGRVGPEADSYEGVDGTSISGVTLVDGVTRVLESGTYDISVNNVPSDPNADPEELDLATLSLQERNTGNITVHRAPAGSGTYSDLTDVEDNETTESPIPQGILEATDDGSLTETDEFAVNYNSDEGDARGDILVYEIAVSGVFGAYASGTTPGPFEIEQEDSGLNVDESTVNLSASRNAAILDNSNQTIYVVTDPSTWEFENGNGIQSLDEDTAFNASYNVTGDYLNNFSRDTLESGDDDEETFGEAELVDREATFDTVDDEVRVQAAADQVISGTTTVAPGTELRVRARAASDETEQAFLKTNETEVNEDGTFEAIFSGEDSFENVEVNTTFDSSIPQQAFEDNAETDSRVVEGDYAEVEISNQTTDGTTATVDRVYLPDGGFVTIHDGTLLDGATFDSVRGTSDYLESGESTDVEVSLDTPYEGDNGTVIAMPHQDTNDNEEYDFVTSEGDDDGAYANADGEAIVDSASLTVDTSTPTPTATATATPEPTATATDEATATETASEDQPGFGAVIALIALLGAALLAARRNAF